MSPLYYYFHLLKYLYQLGILFPSNKVQNLNIKQFQQPTAERSRAEVPNHLDPSRYRDLKKVQVGLEKLPNLYFYHSFDVTRDQKCT